MKQLLLIFALMLATVSSAQKKTKIIVINDTKGKASIYCDDILIGTIKKRSYLAFDVEPGIHNIVEKQKVYMSRKDFIYQDIDVDVKEGETSYLDLRPKFGGLFRWEVLHKIEGSSIVQKLDK